MITLAVMLQALFPKLDYIDGSSLTQFMALRVLLADESPTIKKVFQLALQDYAVEVRPVTSGLDIEMAINDVQPDIIFADILLPKKNGYDVGAQIKNHPEFKSIPYILMWSGFMDIDQDKFQASMAEDKLEKPFDPEVLRALINKYVPKTKEQQLTDFLTFPEIPKVEAEEPKTEIPELESSLKIETEDTDSPDEFEEFSLPPQLENQNIKPNDSHLILDTSDDDHSSSAWSNEKLQALSLSPNPDDDEEELSLDQLIPDIAQEVREKLKSTEPETAKTPLTQQSLDLDSSPEHQIDLNKLISSEKLERIVREQAQTIIENMAWKLVPELATQIIEREIHRLLEERKSKEI